MSSKQKQFKISDHANTFVTVLTALVLIWQMRGIDSRFASMDSRFVSIDSRFASIDARFESLEKRLESLENKFETRMLSFDIRLCSLEKDVSAIKAVLMMRDIYPKDLAINEE